MKLFSLDSPFGRAVALLADLCILNLLFLLSCMPLVTIGAASAALYDTVHALLTQDCSAVSRQYFAGFRRCFGKGTVLMLLSAVAVAAAVADLMLAMALDSVMGLLCTGVVLASLILVLGVLALLPMVVCRDPKERLVELVKTGFLLGLKGTWRTVIAIVLNVTPFALFLFAPALFMQTWMFWFLMGFAVLAYVNNWLLLKTVEPQTWDALRPVKKEK